MRLKAKVTLEAWIDDNATPTGEVLNLDISRIVANLTSEQKARLNEQMSKSSGRDLDFLAELAGVPELHAGPYTLEIDDEAYQDFVGSGYDCTARYIQTDGSYWGHFFADNEPERASQFVYDTETESLVAVLIQVNRSTEDYWVDATDIEMQDLEDSLKNANPDALENPVEWGLDYTDTLPDWAQPAPSMKI